MVPQLQEVAMAKAKGRDMGVTPGPDGDIPEVGVHLQ